MISESTTVVGLEGGGGLPILSLLMGEREGGGISPPLPVPPDVQYC